ncbi:MAG: hypothetical protein HPY59_13410 [Anaerolineae bacterium]|nr:hypothetical protein [Anaerolineae bacterium]
MSRTIRQITRSLSARRNYDFPGQTLQPPHRKQSVPIAALLMILTGLAAACGKAALPEVTRYPWPVSTVSPELYLGSNCSDEYYFRVCAPQSPLGRLGCRQVFRPPESLGGLTPSIPLLVCRVEPAQGESLLQDEYIVNQGCSKAFYLRYVIGREGSYQLIRNIADLKAVFAPIETPAEAISYAAAATGYTPFFGHQPQPGLRYFVNRLEETHAVESSQGYRVNLVDERVCGCGPHTVYGIEITVTRDGEVSAGSPQPLYQDPSLDDACFN